ncbi:MAG: FAD-linked oxidase C-terminal domain-containing protein, partial [Ketobacteraceae bacterium]|nr:FAD-linked oxidase C-terminal domain-containing protein [Ketobacteraceae bacterium]
MTNNALNQALNGLLADRFSCNPAVLDHHSHDESWHSACAPQAVCYATSTSEVSSIMQLCTEYQTPVTAFGTGTGLEGQATPAPGGISLDLSQMNQVLDINSDDLLCRVQAGVTRKQLNRALATQGLFFPVDPGADASIGGMCATRASGTNAVRYGTMKENVLSLRVVTASGDIIETGTSARKSAAGLDLTSLMIGSEGTLGIITEITLKVQGIPETTAVGRLAFDDLAAATRLVTQVLQFGIPIARIELMDTAQVKAVNAHSGLQLPETHTLFLEFHGSDASVREQVEVFAGLAEPLTPHSFAWSTLQEEKNQLWEARHQALYAARQLVPGARVWVTDVCVPISKLSECLLATRRDLDESGLLAPIVGHVGDGNFHALIVLPPGDSDTVHRAEAANERLIARAIACGGTCTGEHGIGIGKIRALEQQHPDTLPLMRQIKKAL